MMACICQNSSNCTLKKQVNFITCRLYSNFFPPKWGETNDQGSSKVHQLRIVSCVCLQQAESEEASLLSQESQV